MPLTNRNLRGAALQPRARSAGGEVETGEGEIARKPRCAPAAPARSRTWPDGRGREASWPPGRHNTGCESSSSFRRSFFVLLGR